MYESTIQDISVVVPMKCWANYLKSANSSPSSKATKDEASSFIGRQIVIDVGSTLLESMSMGTRKNLNLKNLRSQSLSL